MISKSAVTSVSGGNNNYNSGGPNPLVAEDIRKRAASILGDIVWRAPNTPEVVPPPGVTLKVNNKNGAQSSNQRTRYLPPKPPTGARGSANVMQPGGPVQMRAN